MKYHRLWQWRRFGLIGNIKIIICRIVGHRLNENPAHGWCERCGLAYEECYRPLDYFIESGIVKSESELVRKLMELDDD